MRTRGTNCTAATADGQPGSSAGNRGYMSDDALEACNLFEIMSV